MSTLQADPSGDTERSGAPSPVDGRPGPVHRAPPAPHEEFERFIEQYPLTFHPADKRDDVEWAKLPSMAATYYSMLGPDGISPPTQEEFIDHYVNLLRLHVLMQPGRRQAIRYRAERAYPSFIRQHHAELALRSSFPWTFRSILADQRDVDLLVVTDQGVVGLALSVATENADMWARIKAQRGAGQGERPFRVLRVRCQPDEHVVGQFWLHRPDVLIAMVRGHFS